VGRTQGEWIEKPNLTMLFNWDEFLKSTMVIFAVIDIVGSIPIILDLKQKVGDIHSGRASLVALGLMLMFLFVGEGLINFLGIDVNSFAVAGSFIIFFMSLEMILGVQLFKQDANSMKAATIVPVAFPLIAGAGSMTSILSLRAEFHQINIVMAILVNIALVFVVLRLTDRIGRALGVGGIAVLQKVFGIILLSIAVKLFTSNVTHLL
jgi:multiple antibiotic resistance protein